VNVTNCSPFTLSSSPFTPNGIALVRLIPDAHSPDWINEMLEPVSYKKVRGRPSITARTIEAPSK
jgi:hypothetical protein